MRLALVAIAVLAAGCPVHRPPPPQPLRPHLDQIVLEWRHGRPVAGVSVVILQRGQVVYSEGFGVGELDGAPAYPRTTYRLASITKTFTAAAILQQVEAGRVALDVPVVTYLPEYPEATITVRQLLSHTAGLPDYPAMDAFDETVALAPDDLVALFASQPLEFTPGAEFRYSSSGFYLLGLILERVTGHPYADVIEALVAPLWLRSIRVCDDEPTSGEAHGYAARGDEIVPATRIAMANPYAAGALCGSALDVARWFDALAHGRVVTSASWEAMSTPTQLPDGTVARYGLGLSLEPLDGHPRIGHEGRIAGATGRAWYVPEADLVAVVLTNAEVFGVPVLADRLMRAALGWPEPDVGERPLAEADAAPFVGVYARPDGSRVRFGYRDGHLTMAEIADDGEGWAEPMRFVGDGGFLDEAYLFRVTFAPEGTVRLDGEDDSVTATRVP